jgi:hypothetical protein
VVWLTPSLWETLQAWLKVRPGGESKRMFLNHYGQPLSVSGIQYRLKQHCQAAGVSFSCHQLRHAFARRLAENGLPVDSLAKFLGHNQLHTTQRYIDGADPTVRQDFSVAMNQLEATLSRDEASLPEPPKPTSSPPAKKASPAELAKLRQRLAQELPSWLSEALDAYLSWHFIRCLIDFSIRTCWLWRRTAL